MSERPEIPSFRALRGYVREDYAANARSLWAPGFQAVAIYRFGVWACGIRARALGMPLRALYRFLNLGVRNLYGIELPVQTRVGRRFTIAHQHGIVIHKDAAFGDDCLIRHGVTVGALRPGRGTRPPTLGDRVEVGVGAVLVGPIRIGDDAVIGPNAVVMTNVPAGSIVASPQPRIMTPPPRKRAADTDPPRKPAADKDAPRKPAAEAAPEGELSAPPAAEPEAVPGAAAAQAAPARARA